MAPSAVAPRPWPPDPESGRVPSAVGGAAQEHRLDAPGVRDVVEWVITQQHEVGHRAGPNRPELALPAEVARRVDGRGPKRLERRQSALHQDLELVVQGEARLDVRAREDGNARGVETRDRRDAVAVQRRNPKKREEASGAHGGRERAAACRRFSAGVATVANASVEQVLR